MREEIDAIKSEWIWPRIVISGVFFFPFKCETIGEIVSK